MASFVTTLFSDGNDVGLQLGNEEWVRKLAIGSTWTHIRIGVLWQLTGTANTPGGTGWFVGLCSGTSAPFNNASTTNAVGVQSTAALLWVSNSPNPYYQYGSSNMFGCKRVGATTTNTASNLADSAGLFTPTTSGTARRGIFYVDITKGSPNYTIGITMLTSSDAATDVTVPMLLSGMTQVFGSISIGGLIMSNGNGSQTLACDETAGGFDTVDVYSNELANPMLLFEVAIEKLA